MLLKNETKVILLCGSRLALPVLRDLYFHNQLAVIVIPQQCADFIQQVQLLLKDATIPVVTVSKNNFADELLRAIKKHAVNLGLMCSFSHKLPKTVYSLPAKGFYNIHPGLLPAYRGADPVFWQIKNKEQYAGITIHKVDEHYDTGPIVLMDKIKLSSTDTHGILTTRLAELAARSAGTLLKMAGFDVTIPSQTQDSTKANYYHKQQAKDITIDWQTMDAFDIAALINACNPWNKGAVTMLNYKIMRLLDAQPEMLLSTLESAPGTILSFENDAVKVSTINNQAIWINIIYNDEGFLAAGRLKDFGTSIGNRFNNI